jgi:hypothetical protein
VAFAFDEEDGLVFPEDKVFDISSFDLDGPEPGGNHERDHRIVPEFAYAFGTFFLGGADELMDFLDAQGFSLEGLFDVHTSDPVHDVLVFLVHLEVAEESAEDDYAFLDGGGAHSLVEILLVAEHVLFGRLGDVPLA